MMKRVRQAFLLASGLMLALPAAAQAESWPLRIYTNNVSYLASYTNDCPRISATCNAVMMCGRRVYISGVDQVLRSYRRGNRVSLMDFRKSTIDKTVCSVRKR